jgi:hypothetical protein
LRIRSQLFGKCRKKSHIDSWNWNSREEFVNSNHQQSKDDFLANMASSPNFLEISNHMKGVKNKNSQNVYLVKNKCILEKIRKNAKEKEEI